MNSIIEWLLGPDGDRISGVSDWRIDFVADYAQNKGVLVGLVLLFAALTFLTIRSYRREGDAPVRTKATLAVIRILVIALAIILILQPGIVIREQQTLRSYLVVLIDDSISMSFQDEYSDDQAAALRTLLAPDPAGAATQPAGDAPSETDPDLVSRKDIVRRLLARRGGALARLAREHPLIVMRFSTARAGAKDRAGDYTTELSSINVVSDETIGAAQAQPPAGLAEALNALTADGHVTDLEQAVFDALGHVQGRRVAGLVVISDGQITGESTSETDRLAGARTLAAERHVPLYPVCVGRSIDPEARARIKRLRMVSLRGPTQIRPGMAIELSGTIAHDGLAGRTVTVRLQRRPVDQTKWTDAEVSTDVTLTGTKDKDTDEDLNTATQDLTLKITPEQSEKLALGRYVFRAVVDVQDDEEDADDNAAMTQAVLVTNKRVHILLISGDAGWEFQYLRNYLLRTPDMYRLSVWQQNAAREINQVASTGMKLPRLPETLTKLIGSTEPPNPGYDLVILYDPKPGAEGFDETFVKNLRTYVHTHGKGLCYIAGNKYTDHLLPGDKIFGPLAAMLPVRISANTDSAVERIESQRPEPWPVRVTPYGLDHQLTRLGTSGESVESLWDQMPGVFWTHPVLKAKLTARVLLVNTNPSRRTVDNEPEPVLATHSYGHGRVAYMGLDATWRWRSVADGFFHRRFWGNMVEYLATSSARNLVITTGGTTFTTDKRIKVEVDAYDPSNDYKPLDAEEFVMLLDPVRSGRPIRELKLKPVEGRDGHFEITIDAPPTGKYDLMPKTMPGAGGTDEPDKVLKRIVVEPPQAEHERKEADEETMKSLAAEPASHFLPIHEIDTLADIVPSRTLHKARRIPKALWDCRLSLLLIVLLLAVEWIVRKKHNMA